VRASRALLPSEKITVEGPASFLFTDGVNIAWPEVHIAVTNERVVWAMVTRPDAGGGLNAIQSNRQIHRRWQDRRALRPLTTMNPHGSGITPRVRDVNRGKRSYSERLGWPIQQEQGEWAS
jgi:hypothetical protein